jgi:hypothetical protein
MKTTFETMSTAELLRANGGAGRRCDLSGLPSAAQEIIRRESGGDPTAKNPTSTAFGLGQLLIANRRRYMSNPSSTNCSDQIQAFSRYVGDRYGSYDRALAFHKRNGWY